MFAGMGALVQQGFGADDEPWRADPALQGGIFKETLLQGMQPGVDCDSLNRGDLCPFGFDGQNQTAIDRQTVQEHGTCSAVAVVAAFLGTGEPERVAQHIKQALARLAKELSRFAVDRC